MIRLGEKQELTVIKKVEFGVYLAEESTPEEKVLLPIKQVPRDAELGSKIDVFIYKDSSDRLIATTHTPKIMLGDVRVLTVKDTGKMAHSWTGGLRKMFFCLSENRPEKSAKAKRCSVHCMLIRADVCA